MAERILYISYDEQVLIARRALLEREGYVVTSALGFKEAMAACAGGDFHLFILGHAVPQGDKDRLIALFRKNCSAPILSLWRRNEPVLDTANYVAFSEDPAQFLMSVAKILFRGAGKTRLSQPA
jgi:CheY-like chemotaxis protein